MSVWPPAGAVAVDVADGYERLAARGYGYGPAFQGLTAMWRPRRRDIRRGDGCRTRPAASAGSGCIRRCWMRPCMRLVIADAAPTPKWWCRSPGRAYRCMPRARRRCGRGLRRRRPSAVSIELADGLGLPVLSVASMVARPVSEQQLRGGGVRASGGRTGCSRWSGHRRLQLRPPSGAVVRGVRIRCG